PSLEMALYPIGRHRVDHGTICGRSCANSGHYKPLLRTAYEGGRRLPEPGNPKKVFVSHGHDDKAKGDVQSFLETKGLEPIILADQPARETAELLLLVGRLVQTEGYDGELSPAQWMALRYFARANTFSRTPSAFAEFQATTRGTASQAIKALEAGGNSV